MRSALDRKQRPKPTRKSSPPRAARAGAGNPPTATVVGITGGVGTGKSTVGRMLRQRGAVVLSADDAAREVLQPGAPAAVRVAEAFGADYVGPDGRLDRARLAERVFADPEARQKLEDITHPAILS